jgi:cell division protein FtsB
MIRSFGRRAVGGEGSQPPDSDARPSGAARRERHEPPEAARRRRLRRRALKFGLVTLVVCAVASAVVGRGGWLDARALRHEVRRLHGEVDSRRQAVAALRAEVEQLASDPFARERIAREELGLVQPGEIDFLLPREGGALADGPAAAPR